MMYKDTNTGEILTAQEIAEAFEQFRYEIPTQYTDVDEYIEEKIRTGSLEKSDSHTQALPRHADRQHTRFDSLVTVSR